MTEEEPETIELDGTAIIRFAIEFAEFIVLALVMIASIFIILWDVLGAWEAGVFLLMFSLLHWHMRGSVSEEGLQE